MRAVDNREVPWAAAGHSVGKPSALWAVLYLFGAVAPLAALIYLSRRVQHVQTGTPDRST
jgi:hypothetical protein